jgi:hypothetical protein
LLACAWRESRWVVEMAWSSPHQGRDWEEAAAGEGASVRRASKAALRIASRAAGRLPKS